jgi:mucin-19
VEAGTDVGGLVGENGGGVATSWVSGAVASGATSGGVVGADKTTGLFTNVYWDVGTTGRATAFAIGTLGSSSNVTGIGGTTGNDPDSQATYAGFNFTTAWTINAGTSRPYLRNVTPQAPPN